MMLRYPMGCRSDTVNRMTTVKHVLDQKGYDVHVIHPDASVFDALKMMAENNIGSLVVLEDCKIVGVITERDYAREIVLKRRRHHANRDRGMDVDQAGLARDPTSRSGTLGDETHAVGMHPLTA